MIESYLCGISISRMFHVQCSFRTNSYLMLNLGCIRNKGMMKSI